MTAHRPLSPSEARSVYDRIGRRQDTQAFYEDPALDRLVAHGAFEDAQSILEVGCGTGRFAEHLLRDHCPPKTCYVGLDVSPRMVEITRERLVSFGNRTEVVCTDGTLSFNRPDESQDRVVATYLLDLLSADDVHTVLGEAHRLLGPDGRLCLAGLTWGKSLFGRIMSGLWSGVHALRPEWVGGCRPLRMRRFVAEGKWTIQHHEIVRAWGVPSEVLVATPA